MSGMSGTAGRATAASATVLALGVLSACSTPGTQPDDVARTSEITVLAAASLAAPFDEITARFEADHPDVDVRVSYAGSDTLVDQLVAGAPADVLATADQATMQRAVDADVAYDPVLFASNAPTVVVPSDNPADVGALADLADPDVDAVVCAPEVPCGAATRALEERAGVTIHRVSEERSVTDVLAKVAAGQADAGVVYATDARAAGDDVLVIDTPEAEGVVNRYPIAETADAQDHGLAGEFVAAVTSSHGRQSLRDAGFGPP
ncbi:molybdate ABC transporter substrate-binding protein [Paraoerskovia marina]|uniref:molybdate ABC transporter substrate-binding protein n=1 Tax=Paraoerskovia marina TaxID=545619 RepID=UPI000B132FD0|nr:molybdate ABC transporter substrate-binding protein [Paraoerskovia marina]